MKPNNKAGFTIVEVMLFLAISGLLFVGIMVGTGSSINIQRYRDSVASLQSLLQKQYSEVSNVINSESDNVCKLVDNTPRARGQSNCVVLGRFLTTTDGKTITIKSVIGKRIDESDTLESDDVAAFKQYNIEVSQLGVSTYNIEWGASLVDTNTGSIDKGFSMLILRSPSSGIVRTFLNEGIPPTTELGITNLLDVPTALTKPVQLCISSNGLWTGNKMAIMIGANASNAGSIQVLGEKDQSTLGAAYICH